MLVINDDCINCDACVSECPNHAIYAPEDQWAYADGTSLKGQVNLWDGRKVDADQRNKAQNDDIFYIVDDKCNECKGSHSEPQCVSVCPVDAINVDALRPETEQELIMKKNIMHP